MNKRLILLFILAALVWGGIALWPTIQEPSKEGEASWLALDNKSVTQLEVLAGGEKFSLVADQGRWFVALHDRQVRYLADQAKVDALLEFITHNKPTRRLGELAAKDAAQYGLDNPAAVLTIVGNTPWTLRLGGENPSRDGVYAQSSLEKGQCLLLDAKYRAQLTRKPDAYYDLKLVDTPADQMASVRLEGRDLGGWQAARQDKAIVFTWPEELKQYVVDESQMDFYLHNLASLKAAGFAAPDVQAPPAPVLTITVTPKTGAKPEVVEVFEPVGDKSPHLARSTRHQALLALDKERMGKLAVRAFQLRQRKVVSMALGNITRQVLIETGKNGHPPLEMVVSKTDKGWRSTDNGKELVGVDMLTWRLTDLRYEAEPVTELPGEAEKALAWKLFSDDTGLAVELTFYLDPKLGEDRCWIQVNGEARFYPVEDKLLEDLQGQLPAIDAGQK